jgi:hypothetical protein
MKPFFLALRLHLCAHAPATFGFNPAGRPETLINTEAITSSKPLAHIDAGHEKCTKSRGSQHQHSKQTCI